MIISGSPCGRLFQSTLPREERLNYYNYAQNSCLAFQSTLPREERHIEFYIFYDFTNFNPRSHERSDKSPVGAMFVGNNISIHAPTRGATSYTMSTKQNNIFQSTLPREERLYSPLEVLAIKLFQSTLPREERLKLVRYPLIRVVISIHAPTRGATKLHDEHQTK